MSLPIRDEDGEAWRWCIANVFNVQTTSPWLGGASSVSIWRPSDPEKYYRGPTLTAAVDSAKRSMENIIRRTS